MNTYAGWQALYLSMYCKDFYKQVVRNWKGISFLYLFLLIIGSWFLISIKLYVVLDQAMKGPAVTQVFDQLPAVSIKDGELKIDKPSPYELKFQPSPSSPSIVVAVFDATTDDVKGHDDASFMITKHKFFVQSKDGRAQEYELKQFGDVDYTRASYTGIADMIKVWLPILMFSFCAPASFVICAIKALIVGAIGLAVAGAMNIKLTYGELLRLAVVAMTPAVVLDTALKVFGAPPNLLWSLLEFAIIVGFTVFGVTANKEGASPSEEVPGTPTI